jgi:hypothetical protein
MDHSPGLLRRSSQTANIGQRLHVTGAAVFPAAQVMLGAQQRCHLRTVDRAHVRAAPLPAFATPHGQAE